MEGTIDSFALGRYTYGWQEFSADWTATSGGVVTLALVDTITGAIGNDFVLDDITHQSRPRPHPRSGLAAGSGLLGLVAIRRRKRE